MSKRYHWEAPGERVKRTITPNRALTAEALARRRLADIEAGSVQGIPGPEISARIRKIVGR